jgi:Metallopeptidase family M24
LKLLDGTLSTWSSLFRRLLTESATIPPSPPANSPKRDTFATTEGKPLIVAPGMVFAIEPVLYSTQQNFAVFLEDVILVTDTGYDVLSRGMPYTVQEVEDVMRQTSIIDADNRRRR